MDKFVALWEKVPGPLKTVLHVAGGAAIAYLLSVGVDALSGGSLDTNAIFLGLLTAVGTAVVKGLNPADPAYGFTAPVAVDPGPPMDPALVTP